MKRFEGTERTRCKTGRQNQEEGKVARESDEVEIRGFVDKVTGLEIGITVIVKNEQI